MDSGNFRITASHDGSRHFRDNGGYQNSRGSRKGNRNRGQRNRYSDRPPHLGPKRLDDDVRMDGDDAGASGSHSRFNPYGPRHRRDIRPRGGNRAMMDSHTDGAFSRLGLPVGNDLKRDGNDWYRVTIPFGKKLDKDFIIRSLSSVAAVPFIPIHFHIEGGEALFYVKGGAEARAIQNTSKRITVPEGFKMVVKINRCGGPPVTPLTEEVTKKIKECMSKRYDVAALSLNLTDLANDEDLKKGDVFISLRRSQVVKKIIDIIGENIPDLKVLDLSKNHLQDLEFFAKIEEKAPKLQQLNLAHNQLRVERELQVFAKLNLEELCLDGNPLCDKFADRTTYISAIRKRFPKVLKLDGNVLPPPITFDVEASTTLPSPKGSFFPNVHVQEIIARFAEQYFTLYDSDNRQPLIDAYHEQAVFSVSNYSWSGSGKQASLSDYHMKCRNLARTKDTAQRQHRLKSGRSAVIALLTELPATRHDPVSFTVDVGFTSATMLSFTVHGLFKEVSNKTDRDVIRQFSRNFVAVPNGPGVALTSDMLFVCNASPEMAKKYFKAPATAAAPVAPVASIVPPVVSLTATTVIPTPALRQQMIVAFCVQSGMNENFSSMCLEQNDWDYEKAAAVFTDMKQKNSVPPEAFIK